MQQTKGGTHSLPHLATLGALAAKVVVVEEVGVSVRSTHGVAQCQQTMGGGPVLVIIIMVLLEGGTPTGPLQRADGALAPHQSPCGASAHANNVDPWGMGQEENLWAGYDDEFGGGGGCECESHFWSFST